MTEEELSRAEPGYVVSSVLFYMMKPPGTLFYLSSSSAVMLNPRVHCFISTVLHDEALGTLFHLSSSYSYSGYQLFLSILLFSLHSCLYSKRLSH